LFSSAGAVPFFAVFALHKMRMPSRNISRLLAAGFLLGVAGPAAAESYYVLPPGATYSQGGALAGGYDGYDDPDPYWSDDRPMRAPARRGLLPDAPDDGLYDDPAPPPRRAARRPPTRFASLPPDADPAYSTPRDFDAEVDPSVATRELVDDPTREPAGTITIDTRTRKLYLAIGGGQAYAYGVGVGREGFAWKGVAQIGRKAFWPGWTPPKEMLLRRPDLPDHMDGGLENPLGARALYLFKGPKDTLFRIHGTNEPDTIGQAVSSGCIRMLNADVIDLYGRVAKGTRVVVR
jgi:lipoprotein-anchoring transpeptidase ErfK/SrfK